MQVPRPDLCIVVPAYNEEGNLPLLLDELNAVLPAEGIKFDVLFVDDGSRDRTPQVIRELVRIHKNVRALMLSRNFGHQAAVSTGLVYAKGNAIAIMDADLQDRPSDLLQLYRRYLEGADVVYSIRRSRPEGMPKRAIYAAFYRLVNRVATIQMPLDSGDFCVMSPAFVERLNRLPEKSRYVRGLRAWLGGRQTGVPVDRGVRRTGYTNYTVTKLFRLAIDGLTSFSYAPLRIASMLGFAMSAAALVGGIVVLSWKVMGLLPSGAGLGTIALSVLFIGGVQLLTVGILGEYIGRIFEEVKARPVAIVSEILGQESDLD